MAYESPIISEVGSVESLTLGDLQIGPERDTSSWNIGRWHIRDSGRGGDPSTSS